MPIDSDTAHSLSRLLMATGFLSAMACCAYRRRAGFAIFYGLAAIETYTKYRYPLHVSLRDWLVTLLPPGMERQQVQTIMLVCLTLFAIVAGYSLMRMARRTSRAMKMIWLGTLGVVALLFVEMISLHAVDSFIYTIDLIFVRSGWMYALFALVTVAGALSLPGRYRQH